MNARVDALRERLLAPELELARQTLAQGGARALVANAVAHLQEMEALHARFASFSRELERAAPQQRPACIERYLRQTSDHPRALELDLCALRRGREAVLDLAALGERNTRRVNALESQAEACLALARVALGKGPSELEVRDLLNLAETPGRWSRRTEALAVLRQLARAGFSPETRAQVLTSAKRLAAPSEQRWVQVAALAALAAIDIDAAHAFARERLASRAGGDDFLVRARIVELAARHRKLGWLDLLPLAALDPSELVRMTAARVELLGPSLERVARNDSSHRVRALALIRLTKRLPNEAFAALAHALVSDPHGFVVQTAAEELVSIARKTGALGAEPRHALWSAAQRPELSANVRAACADALLEVDVLAGESRSLYAELAASAKLTPLGGSSRVSSARVAAAKDEAIARVLSVLARDDFALGIDRTRAGVVLHRGEPRTFAAWRLLFELLHPSPSKRQAVLHTLARSPRGVLRAPPAGLAEVTATRVPGERVLVNNAGGWGRHLPLVDDLISSRLWFAREVSLSSPYGITAIMPPRSFWRRLRGRLALTLGYARFVELRLRSLASQDSAVQAAYARQVERETGISIEITPHAFDVGVDRHELPLPIGLARTVRRLGLGTSLNGLGLAGLAGEGQASPDALTALHNLWDELANYALLPGGNRLPQLAAYGLLLLFAILARGIAIRHRIEGDRKAIPLVIGGWGTRGKSGTERLKAALFQGLGYECLVKTTGCEAMWIHAIPGLAAREVFIYRPYDKATVWEQRELLTLARRLGVRVFLWECMALQPELVNLLQAQWMQDDCSTITNAYPDHEEVQGPTGLDVASTISEFVPVHGKLFTTEEQMLPLIEEQARARVTKTQRVSARDAELISEDLLARFPYAEHPRNIALVSALARSFGVSASVAIAEMADNVVPDLGALKTYPTVPWRGRSLSFTNGMGANDRTGTLANFQRSGFNAHDPAAEPGRWIVTLVNNRADRLARSEVFATAIVEEIAAHRHVLIGTNVAGLLGFIEQALDKHLAAAALTRDLPDSAVERRRALAERIERAFARLKLGRTDGASVAAEAAALGFSPIDAALVARLLEPGSAAESYAAGRQIVRDALRGVCDPEQLPFQVSMIARRRSLRAVHAVAEQNLETNPAAVDSAFRAAYRAIFLESVVPIYDSGISGDAILECITSAVPPGVHASIMGIQNIKGTGLDFVYRWVSIELVSRVLAGLGASARDAREQALTQLMIHDDYGLLDATLALSAVEQARSEAPDSAELPYDAVIARLRELVASRIERSNRRLRARSVARAQKFVGETLDFIDSVRRRGMAARVVDELVLGRISHSTAALRMRAIVARSKGMWLLPRS